MVKSISAGMTSAIDADVTELAVCVEIERDDGRVYRMTNHDTDLTVSGKVYRSDIPFNLSSISSTAGLAVDNTEIQLALDGTLFVAEDFQNGAFKSAEVTIFKTKFSDTSAGRLILRKGWFGETNFNQHGYVAITVVGLLKVLDLMVGRLYQPACDADLGDKRCRIAIDGGQVRAPDNVYNVGDWRYIYDTASMTAIAITNHDFEDDGARSVSQAITGWTKSDPSAWTVAIAAGGLNNYEGTYSLYGSTFPSATDVEHFLYQDIDLATAGLSTTDIDDGKISCMFSVAVATYTGVNDKPRLRVEFINANDEIIDRKDTRYIDVYEEDRWERHHVGGPIIAGSRTARIYLYGYIPLSGSVSRVAFDDVQGWWWDHVAGNPNSDTIHKVSRIFSIANAIDTWGSGQNGPAVAGETYIKRPCNPSFESGAPPPPYTNSDASTFVGANWRRVNGAGGGDYWIVNTTLAGITAPLGTYMLIGGDDGSGTQSTYGVYQNMEMLADWGIASAEIDQSRYAGVFSMTNVFGDTTSAVRAILDWKDAGGSSIETQIVIDWTTNAGAPIQETLTGLFTVPAGSRSVDLYLYARSPVGSSSANVAFDDIKLYLLDACAASSKDLEFGVGDAATVFDYTSGNFTFDGSLIWKAHTHHIAYDTVASVTDKKNFAATTLTGSDGAYNTALIRWISGNNAGRKNVVRVWTDTGKGIKTYFDQVGDIQVGDRFQIIAPCFRRYTEDCITRFDNAINFRGFPFLPGRRG